MFEPRLFARYLLKEGRIDDALAFIEPAYARGPESLRSSLASSWANALDFAGRGREAAMKNRLAIELDPENWIAASNLVATVLSVEGEESAAREGRRLAARISASSDKPRTSLNALQNYQPLVEDWTGFIDSSLQALEATSGKGALAAGDTNIYLADAEANRHDWRAANRYLLAGAGDRAEYRAQRQLNDGLRAIEDGRIARAVASFETFKAMWDADANLQWSFYFHPCYLGLAYGLAGRFADANRIFDAAGQWSICATLRADVIEASGDHASVDAAYAAAARLAPSLPRPYHHWGIALLARGNRAAAEAKFEAAHARAPHWADPLKSLGDTAMAGGEWKDAADFYDRASAFAPGWNELAAARRAAHAKVAALPWWKRWLG